MKINVPIIKTVDLLIVGLTPESVRLAIETQKAGKKVFAITGFTYAGEGFAAHYDFTKTADDDFNYFFPEGLPKRPMEFKSRLELALIRNNIDFLYQVRPVRPVNDSDGSFCGLLVADRTGFQIIATNVLFDATDRADAARICDVPCKPFIPGTYAAERFLLSGEPVQNAEALNETIMVERGKYRKYRFSEHLQVHGNSAKDLAKLTVDVKLHSWNPQMVYGSDLPKIALDDGVSENYHPTDELPIAVTGQKNLVPPLLNRVCKKPFSIPGKAGHSDYDVVRKDSPIRFNDCETIPFELNTLLGSPEKYDTVITGGGTAGAPAAIAAARSGAKTLCVESLYELGGICTLGRIPTYYHGNIVGFTKEVDAGIFALAPEKAKTNADIRAKDPVWKAQYFLKAITESGGEVRFGTNTIAVIMQENRVCGIITVSETGISAILGKAIVDSTGDSDIAAYTGAECEVASPDEPSIQGAGMSPIIPGMWITNTDFQFICDHDILDTTRAFIMGRGKFSSQFDLIQIPNTRERRRIVGDIRLQPQDFFCGRKYHDTMYIARSNFDTHGFVIHPMFMIEPPSRTPFFASVPLRAMLPKGLDNLLVTGLGVSAHRDCMPLIRMQADVQNQGYAAGLAAAAVAAEGKSFRMIDVRAIQRKLVKCGNLPESVLTDTDRIAESIPDDAYGTLSKIFTDPQKELPGVAARFADERDFRNALILAFFKKTDGLALLQETLNKAKEWDQGWNYRGMGQFGFSVSSMDAALFALTLNNAANESVLHLLDLLKKDSEFSHFRSVCYALMKHPQSKAAAKLKALLNDPEMHGFAIDTYAKTLEANGYDLHETWYRNSQLKEIYLAKALNACDPEDQDAQKILKSYREGLMTCFARFA